MPRLFVALELPDTAKSALVRLQHAMPIGEASVSFARPETLHLTIVFLGDVADDATDTYARALADVAARHAPMALTVAGGGVFPRRSRPRVLWAGLGGDTAALAALAADTRAAFAALGHDVDPRPWTAHVTLGRVRVGRPAAAADHLAGVGELASFRAEEIVLFESRLHPKGAIHTPRARPTLGGPAA